MVLKPSCTAESASALSGTGRVPFRDAAFGFQDHPTSKRKLPSATCFPTAAPVWPKRAVAQKPYPSLEELVKDDKIEAVFVADDPP